MGDKKYFDLIDRDIALLSVARVDSFSCALKDDKGGVYDGFILARSVKGNALTVCDIDFHKSGTDDKYQPRIIFRRTDEKFKNKAVKSDVKERIISFSVGVDGYREFWKMINFLKKFKDFVDTGEFGESYQVVSNDQFKKYLESKKQGGDLSGVLDDVGPDMVLALRSASNVKILKSHKEKLEGFIGGGSSEIEVQGWLDEDDHGHREERAMIFGLEFINHKREGGASGKRYDLLTRIGSHSEERVLIELKGPKEDVFDIKKKKTINNKTLEYNLSDSLSRAMPQILEYKRLLEEKSAGDPELEKIGEDKKLHIAKCIIIIGSHKEDSRWKENLRSLRNSLNSSLEIWTYTDLINKLDSTIKNLERDSAASIETPIKVITEESFKDEEEIPF